MGWRRIGKGDKGGGQDGGQANATVAKATTNAAMSGTMAGAGSNSEPRFVDPQREGVNAWFTAASEYVHKHDKLVDPLDQDKVNMHDGVFWLAAGSPDPNNPGAVVNPPFVMNDAHRHRALPAYSDTAPAGPAAAVNAHRSGLAWIKAFWASRRAQVVNIKVQGRRVGAGGVNVGQPTAADYENERLSSVEEFLNVIHVVYPGSERKSIRTDLKSKLDKVTEWAAAMLKAMPKVVKKESPVLAEFEAVLNDATNGHDGEWQRRASTGLTLYTLNYAVSLAMSRAPGAMQAAQQRARDWATASRGKAQTHHEWRAKLTDLGLQQEPPMAGTDQAWKERFIAGANLGQTDHFRAFQHRGACNLAQLMDKDATELAILLGDIIAYEQQIVKAVNGASSSTGGKPDSQDGKPGANKSQDGKAATAGQAGSKGQSQAPKSGNSNTQVPTPKTDFRGECWNCGKRGHRITDCKESKKGEGAVAGMGKTRKVLAAQVVALEEKLEAEKVKAEMANKRRRDGSSSGGEESGSESESEQDKAAFKAFKVVLAAQKAVTAKDAKKSRKGSAQLRGSKYGDTSSD